MAESHERLAKSHEETREELRKLAEAQRRTEAEVRRLAKGMSNIRSELGGLGRTLSYALENEAFRVLPRLLKERYHIEIVERFVRTYVGEREVNFFAEGQRNGERVLIVGEAKSRLDTGAFRQLGRTLQAVREAQDAGELPPYQVIPLFVTHMAHPKALERAKREGVIVVQSFEW